MHTDPLLGSIESSLMKVNHQIWLLRNVFWLYLLPLGVGIALFFIVVCWSSFKVLPTARVLLTLLVCVLFEVLVFWGIYRLNQRAVRKDLNPRKNELELFLKGLTNDITIT
jgi:Flp pilus assembly protein TadB